MSLTIHQPVALTEDAAHYASLNVSNRTALEYTSDLRHYSAWCAANGHVVLPSSAEQVANYMAAYAPTLSVATIERRLSAISAAHRQAGLIFDTKARAISMVFGGIKRAHGEAQKQVAPATGDAIRAMVAMCDGSLAGLRDRAILLLGFAGGMRRSEIVALTVADVRINADHAVITIRRSKGDQTGIGRKIIIQPAVVIEALKAWLAASAITSGMLFRSVDQHGHMGESLSGRAIANLIKARAAQAGLDAPEEFSGHSLRAGFATEAAANGAEERDIARTTGHRDMNTLRRYIRDGEALASSASSKLGL